MTENNNPKTITCLDSNHEIQNGELRSIISHLIKIHTICHSVLDF